VVGTPTDVAASVARGHPTVLLPARRFVVSDSRVDPGFHYWRGRLLTMTTAADSATSEESMPATWPSECEQCGSPLLLRGPTDPCARCWSLVVLDG
jgi:hypothetical protein